MSEEPIARGWNVILDEAPNAEEREKVEKSALREVFYAGAAWLWQMVEGFDDDKELKLFLTEAINAELKHWRATRTRQQ